jgi:rfaE bifunctional protein kinase chain/domain
MDTLDLTELAHHAMRLEGGRVLVIGDVMLDTYLVGDAFRISPEAPVPVVKVEETRHLLGGAGNVARNIASLGGKATLVSIVGDDENGRRIASMLETSLVEPRLIRSQNRPTTVKTRVLARNQQMIRLDMEDTRFQGEEGKLATLHQLAQIVDEYDVVVVSDYGKGMVGPDTLPNLLALAQQRQPGRRPRILVDPKPQNKTFYKGAYLITPNAKETGEIAQLPVSKRQEIMRAGRRLRLECGVENVLTTLGADGMALFRDRGPTVHVATTARQVFDVTGAGDTVIAATALALSSGFPLVQSCILANYAAGIVVGKVGASTVSLEELQAVIEEYPPEMTVWD